MSVSVPKLVLGAPPSHRQGSNPLKWGARSRVKIQHSYHVSSGRALTAFLILSIFVRVSQNMSRIFVLGKSLNEEVAGH